MFVCFVPHSFILFCKRINEFFFLKKSQRAIREFDAKRMLFAYCEKALKDDTDPALKALVQRGMGDLSGNLVAEYRSGKSTRDTLIRASPFLANMKLVAKPDQLVKRRGKLGLLCVNKSLDECLSWIAEREMRLLICFLCFGLFCFAFFLFVTLKTICQRLYF